LERLKEVAMAIITISREMGTGAYSVAKEVAKKLKYTLIDGPKVAELAPRYGISQDLLERIDEKPPAFISKEDRLHAAHLYTIELILLECALKGNVILYGRGGQDLLKGLRNVLRLRFIAPFDERVENLAEREWIDPDLARDIIRKSDHQRGGFIHFYFDRNWQDPLGYDMVFNTSHMSTSAMIDSIIAASRDPKLKEAEEESRESLEEIILCKKIEAELLKHEEIENMHFAVTAQSGKVALSGHVYSEKERESALAIAADIDGVQKVVDNLQVVNFKKHRY
jgi:cytidylate kinase